MAARQIGPAITKVNLKLIQAFLLVAESGSFREAAEATGRSQSAVSAQIRQLEGQIGVQLLRRTTRRVSLTAEGEKLIGHARKAMAELQSGFEAIRAAAEAEKRRVHFSCTPLIAANYVPEMLSLFARRYPAVEVRCVEAGSDRLLDGVRNGTSAFAVGGVAPEPGLDLDVFLEDCIYALVPNCLCGRWQSTIPLRELAKLPLVLLGASTPMRKLIEQAMRSCALEIGTHHEFTTSQTLIRMAEAGLGAAILPSYTLPSVYSPNVRALRIIEPTITRRIAIITLSGKTLSPPAAYLAEIAKTLIIRSSIRQGGEPIFAKATVSRQRETA